MKLLAPDIQARLPAVRSGTMIVVQRGTRILLSLAAMVLLLRPLDCFTSSPRTPEAADCCRKGKCHRVPGNADDCCKANIPDIKLEQAALSRDNSLPAFPLASLSAYKSPSIAVATTWTHQPAESSAHAPPMIRLTLPLLI